MEEIKKTLSFHLFDGEGGGEGGDGAAASTGAFEQGNNTGEPQQRTVYGKQPEGNGAPNSQVGSDKGGQADSLEAEFEALTGKGGKFHDLMGQRVSSAIQARFKNQQDLQAQMDDITNSLSDLFQNYDLEAGDYEGLKSALAHDDALYQAGAERAGLDIDQYKQKLKLQADAERGRKIQEQFEQQLATQQMYARWEQEEQALQSEFPNFDLARELDANEQFAKLVWNGADVRTAFVSTHLDDILAGATDYAQRNANRQVVNRINQRAARPAENALGHNSAVRHVTDPSKLTKEDFDEIDRIVEAGGSVRF